MPPTVTLVTSSVPVNVPGASCLTLRAVVRNLIPNNGSARSRKVDADGNRDTDRCHQRPWGSYPFRYTSSSRTTYSSLVVVPPRSVIPRVVVSKPPDRLPWLPVTV